MFRYLCDVEVRINVRRWYLCQKEFFTDNLLVRIYFIIEMAEWISLAAWEFEFPITGTCATWRCASTCGTLASDVLSL